MIMIIRLLFRMNHRLILHSKDMGIICVFWQKGKGLGKSKTGRISKDSLLDAAYCLFFSLKSPKSTLTMLRVAHVFRRFAFWPMPFPACFEIGALQEKKRKKL